MMEKDIVDDLQHNNDEDWGRIAQEAVTDEEAFVRLYNHFFPRVYQHLLGKTKDDSLADEIVSSTFMKMYQHLSEYNSAKGAFSTWLFRIAHNELMMVYRSKAYQTSTPLEDNFDLSSGDEDSPEEETLSKERNEQLKAALQQLSDRERKIVTMTYWLDMKSQDIAEELGMTPNNVRVVLKRARESLKAYLGEFE
ncbi:MAG: sigma-70 family RNA polymerase sigma factor [Anaerovibrio sp.]|nr:sigma-70 family RNA polymerase sigma factor [Anaerovibrio sp.]